MSSALPSSGADGVGDTTLFIATAASYASDGPTLPIIGGAGEHSERVAPNPENRPTQSSADRGPKKKKRTNNDLATDTKGPEFQAKKSKVEVEGLYQPWTLLPVGVLQQIEKRLNGEWEKIVDVVVWTKNQNVKSGINRLKGLLGFEKTPDAAEMGDKKLKQTKNDRLIAVSAYGEGTTKLVGIVEMTKRIVGGAGRVEDEDAETWFTYTSLSSTNGKDVKNKMPVLTVWLSRKRVPELKNTFGEQTLKTNRTTAAD